MVKSEARLAEGKGSPDKEAGHGQGNDGDAH